MSKLTLILIVATYLMVGIFVGGVLDDYGNGPHPLAVLLWPLLLIGMILFGIIDFLYRLGKKLGDMLFGR